MKILSILTLAGVFICVPLSAGPAVSPYLAITGGVAVSAETDYGSFVTIPASSAAASVQTGLVIGDGLWAAMIQGGQSYQATTAFTEDWYRYRGFYSINLAAGPRVQSRYVNAYMLGGGMLARYDLSFSYFFFPYFELGLSIPVLAFGDHFSIDAGFSAPVYLRADAFSVGLRAVAVLYYTKYRRPSLVEIITK